MSAVLSVPPVAPAASTGYRPPIIAGEGYPLTDAQRALIARADELGRDKLAPRAARYDREASFPFENFDDMRAAGFYGICIPKSHGGLGADFPTYTMVAATLGRYCGSTPLAWNMHVSTTLWAGVLSDSLDMTSDQRRSHEGNRDLMFERVVKHGKLYAQPFSEGSAAAAGKTPFGTTAAKVDGGWLVNGKKIFASLSGAADYYGVVCTEDKVERSTRDTLLLSVPADAPGVTVVGEWDPLGMRGTVSRNLIFKDVFVADTELLLPRGCYHQSAVRWPHMFTTLSPTYMGIAQAAYDFTVQYLRGEVAGTPPVKRRMYPTKQMAVAEMRIKLEQMRSIFLHSSSQIRIDPPKDVRLRLYAAHFSLMEGANDICRLAIRTCGGQSMLRSLPLERMYRDSRCGSLMLPWTAELVLDRMGREALYESGENDD